MLLWVGSNKVDRETSHTGPTCGYSNCNALDKYGCRDSAALENLLILMLLY